MSGAHTQRHYQAVVRRLPRLGLSDAPAPGEEEADRPAETVSSRPCVHDVVPTRLACGGPGEAGAAAAGPLSGRAGLRAISTRADASRVRLLLGGCARRRSRPSEPHPGWPASRGRVGDGRPPSSRVGGPTPLRRLDLGYRTSGGLTNSVKHAVRPGPLWSSATARRPRVEWSTTAGPRAARPVVTAGGIAIAPPCSVATSRGPGPGAGSPCGRMPLDRRGAAVGCRRRRQPVGRTLPPHRGPGHEVVASRGRPKRWPRQPVAGRRAMDIRMPGLTGIAPRSAGGPDVADPGGPRPHHFARRPVTTRCDRARAASS